MGNKPVAAQKRMDKAADDGTGGEAVPESVGGLIDVGGQAAQDIGTEGDDGGSERHGWQRLSGDKDSQAGKSSKIVGPAGHDLKLTTSSGDCNL